MKKALVLLCCVLVYGVLGVAPYIGAGGTISIAYRESVAPLPHLGGTLMLSAVNQIVMMDLASGHIYAIFDGAYTPEAHLQLREAVQRPGHPEQLLIIGTPSRNRFPAGHDQFLLVQLAASTYIVLPDLDAPRIIRIPQWHTSGETFVFSGYGNRSSTRSSPYLWVYSLSDGLTGIDTSLDGADTTINQNPRWLPDGSIAVGIGYIDSPIVRLPAECVEVGLCQLNTEEHVLAQNVYALLSWHPTQNRFLALVSEPGGEFIHNLWEFDTSTQTQRRITDVDESARVLSAVYSPDGAHISYSFDPDGIQLGRPDSAPQIVVIVSAVDYTEQATLPLTGAMSVAPAGSDLAWGPPLPDGVLPTLPPPTPQLTSPLLHLQGGLLRSSPAHLTWCGGLRYIVCAVRERVQECLDVYPSPPILFASTLSG